MASPERHQEPRVGIVGTGAVASALAAELSSAGLAVTLWGRDGAAAARLVLASGSVHASELGELRSCDVIVLAVSDGAAAEVAGALANAGEDCPPLLHTGGPTSGAESMGASAPGVELGSIHPLVAVPRAARDGVARDRFRGMPFAVEASGDSGLARARELAAAVGAVCIEVPPGAKLVYHALATLVATGVVSLVDRAARALLEASGASEEGGDGEEFRRAYGRLALSAASNLDELDGAEALTGALARGDEALIARHRKALEPDPGARALYDAITGAARAMLAASEIDGDDAPEEAAP